MVEVNVSKGFRSHFNLATFDNFLEIDNTRKCMKYEFFFTNKTI